MIRREDSTCLASLVEIWSNAKRGPSRVAINIRLTSDHHARIHPILQLQNSCCLNAVCVLSRKIYFYYVILRLWMLRTKEIWCRPEKFQNYARMSEHKNNANLPEKKWTCTCLCMAYGQRRTLFPCVHWEKKMIGRPAEFLMIELHPDLT